MSSSDEKSLGVLNVLKGTGPVLTGLLNLPLSLKELQEPVALSLFDNLVMVASFLSLCFTAILSFLSIVTRVVTYWQGLTRWQKNTRKQRQIRDCDCADTQ